MLKIETIGIDEILEYENNAKLHTAEQVDQIASSIEQFGNCDPIGVWHNGNGDIEVVEGHGRLMALRKLGFDEIKVIFLDHLSDNQRKAYALVHNKTTIDTGFDVEILYNELKKIEAIDMSEFDFFVFSESDDDDDVELPDDFREYGDDIETKHKCAMCGYEW